MVPWNREQWSHQSRGEARDVKLASKDAVKAEAEPSIKRRTAEEEVVGLWACGLVESWNRGIVES